MKTKSHWAMPVTLFAVGLTAAGGLNLSATAVTNSTTYSSIQESQPNSIQPQGELLLAQGLVGQCRAVNQRIFVYAQRSTTSQTIRTLAPNETVTLADNGSAGWIAINAPATGYVQAQYLKPCTGANNPPPVQPSSLCRVVTYRGSEGLAIRSGPNKTGTRVGGIRLGDRVTLAKSPPDLTYDSDRRAWVQITAPVAGWISYGYPSSNSLNVGRCP
ncbi:MULTISPECIES: SH3 domain-containing protein [Cyanophyceae]|uniref:SH3 domain-containing protein n=1 Tax=Cyanophyceae TaxID=3028117 RepID=UPI001687B1A3|nr:SH3 domain-containing protein [Trichocoleus sp. FACHB-69]MBD1935068.1 SH3 domain-containing protein [Trichocoleus sp. FACHB-69]